MKTVKEILQLDLENKQDAITADTLREGFYQWMADKQTNEKDRALYLVERDKVRITRKQMMEAYDKMKAYGESLEESN